jgi:DNA-binding Lrp family transcriptional regulator
VGGGSRSVASVEAILFLLTSPGTAGRIVAELPTHHGVRRATLVIGAWDALAMLEGDDVASIGAGVLADIHQIDGVQRTLTAPVVPPDRLGTLGGGFGIGRPPQLAPGDACYVQIRAGAGSVPVLYERLAEMEAVSGVAALAGEYDLLVEIREPWEVASGWVLEHIRTLEGVLTTSTLIGFSPDEADEERDRFSSWS